MTLPLTFIRQRIHFRAFSSNFGQGPSPKIAGKSPEMIDLTSKFGEINDIEHNKGSKIFPQNQVILHCIMSSILLSDFINLTQVHNFTVSAQDSFTFRRLSIFTVNVLKFRTL